MLTRAAETAARLITRHGGPAVLVRPGEQVNPWAGDMGPVELIPVVILETGAAGSNPDDTSLQDHDLHGLIRANVTPDLADKLRLRGHDHALVDLHPVQPSPAGPIIAWSFHARR